MGLTLRTTKGTPLSYQEMDGNFTYLLGLNGGPSGSNLTGSLSGSLIGNATGSFSGSFTGSYFGTASYALTSSYSLNSGLPTYIYAALLTQTSTNAPTTPTPGVNTLPTSPTYSYVSPGIYYLISSGSFPADKVYIYIGRNSGTPGDGIEAYRLDNNTIRIDTSLYSASIWSFTNGRLSNTSFKVEVYI